MCVHAVWADKIHMKSGAILEGTLKEVTEPSVFESDWCTGEHVVQLWTKEKGDCLNKADILQVEQSFLTPQGPGPLAKADAWGAELNGYKTQLIPAGETYTVGQPMNFHLLLTNVSSQAQWYDAQAVSQNSFKIEGPQGKDAHYKAGTFQTFGGQAPLAPGEIVTLMQDKDITETYIITEPGRYKIRFLEGSYGMGSAFPSSNGVEFDVQEGTPHKQDVFILSLIDILPDSHWRITKGWNYPPGWREDVPNVSVDFEYNNRIFATLWQTDQEARVRQGTDEKTASEFLGTDADGHFYYLLLKDDDATKQWPALKEDVIRKLDIQK